MSAVRGTLRGRQEAGVNAECRPHGKRTVVVVPRLWLRPVLLTVHHRDGMHLGRPVRPLEHCVDNELDAVPKGLWEDWLWKGRWILW